MAVVTLLMLLCPRFVIGAQSGLVVLNKSAGSPAIKIHHILKNTTDELKIFLAFFVGGTTKNFRITTRFFEKFLSQNYHVDRRQGYINYK